MGKLSKFEIALIEEYVSSPTDRAVDEVVNQSSRFHATIQMQ